MVVTVLLRRCLLIKVAPVGIATGACAELQWARLRTKFSPVPGYGIAATVKKS
jgi:hypothetical protein